MVKKVEDIFINLLSNYIQSPDQQLMQKLNCACVSLLFSYNQHLLFDKNQTLALDFLLSKILSSGPYI